MQGVTLQEFGIILYFPVWAVVLITCALGAFVGAVNGVLIAYLRVPAFVATLGVLYCARGVALLMTNGLTYNNLGGRPELGNTGFDWLGFNKLRRADRCAGAGNSRHHLRHCFEPHCIRPLALCLGRQ